MDGYIEILKIMLRKNTNGYDNIIRNILIKIFDIYYLDRNIQNIILITYLKNIILICIIY